MILYQHYNNDVMTQDNHTGLLSLICVELQLEVNR